MAKDGFTDEQLAMLLQVSRDFAFEQIAQDMPLLPYATCVDPQGEMNFVRFAEPGTDLSPDEVVTLTFGEVAKEASDGGLLAVAVVSAVKLEQGEDGMTDAIRIHVEAPRFARQFLAFYSLSGEQDGGGKQARQPLSPGKLVPFDAQPVVFGK